MTLMYLIYICKPQEYLFIYFFACIYTSISISISMYLSINQSVKLEVYDQFATRGFLIAEVA